MNQYENDIEQLKFAIKCLENNKPQRASWRIADALGSIKATCGCDLMGIDCPTGLGWQLIRRNAGEITPKAIDMAKDVIAKTITE